MGMCTQHTHEHASVCTHQLSCLRGCVRTNDSKSDFRPYTRAGGGVVVVVVARARITQFSIVCAYTSNRDGDLVRTREKDRVRTLQQKWEISACYGVRSCVHIPSTRE